MHKIPCPVQYIAEYNPVSIKAYAGMYIYSYKTDMNETCSMRYIFNPTRYILTPTRKQNIQ